MFDIGATEILLIAVVALLVIGPHDLPRAMRTVGNWMGKARATTRHFRSGIDTMIREAELEEQQKKWATENERIMREHPPEATATDAATTPAEPAPAIYDPVNPREAPARAKPVAPPSGVPPEVSEPEFALTPPPPPPPVTPAAG